MSKELQNAWDTLQSELNAQPIIHKEDIMKAIKQESINPLIKIKSATNSRLGWYLIFTLICGAGLLGSLGNTDAMLIWGVGFAFYSTGLTLSWNALRKITIDPTTDIRTTLEVNYRQIRRLLHIEESIGYFMFPSSVVLGASLSKIEKGYDLVQIFSDGQEMTRILLVAILFGALAFIYVRWANNRTYGNYLDQLKSAIDMMNRI